MTLPAWSPGHIVAGKYTVQAMLGRNDNSLTYAAITEPNLEVILRVFTHDAALEQSMSNLVRTLEDLEPYALRVREVARDKESGALFIAVERSRHPALATLVELCPLTLKEGIAFAESLGSALDAAHHKGLHHLALAPANVFVGPAPECSASLADFGLPPPIPPTIDEALWRAPEQLDLKGESTATDVFSAALVIYFALTGRSYWRAGDHNALRAEHAQARVPASLRGTEIGVALPHSIDAPFERALSSDPSKRPKSVGELARQLATACKKDLEQPSASAPVVSDLPKVMVERPRPPVPRNDEPTVHTVRKGPDDSAPVVVPGIVTRGEPTVLLPAQVPRSRKWMFVVIGAVLFLGVAIAAAIWINKKPAETPTIASAPIPSVTPSATNGSTTGAIANTDPVDSGPPPLGPDEGDITVVCDPEPCDLVMVDAKRWDDYPTPYRVKEGKHGVGISKAHYWGDWKLVTVKAGEHREVTFKLTPRPPGYKEPTTVPTRKPGRGRP